MERRKRVTVTYRGAPGQRIDLLGDLPSWKVPHELTETTPGTYEVTLDLAPGVYRYKLRLASGEWLASPGAPVDHVLGFANSELVVEGASPPLVFAPDRRHVGRHVGRPTAPRGPATLTVHFEVPEGHPLPSVHLAPGSRRAEAEPVVTRGGRVLARAVLPFGEEAEAIVFETEPLQTFSLPPHARSRSAIVAGAPAWLEGAVFYGIFVDRWLRGQSTPDPRARPRDTQSREDTFYGGDLDGVRGSLDHLVDLGVTAVVLTPIFPSPTPHRYDPVDLRAVDPALGGDGALVRLVEDAHARGLRVIVDAPLTHVNHLHPAFQSVLRDQERSPFASWFEVRAWPVVDLDPSTYRHYYDRPELPWLALDRPEPREEVIQAVLHLAELGADGARLDAMDDAPDGLWSELRRRVRARFPDFLFLGEVVIDNLAHYAEERGVDTATDFTHREAMLDYLARGVIDARAFWERTEAEGFRLGPFEPAGRLLFLDNHDTARFRSLAIQHERLRLALLYLTTRPEPCWLTYGTELGLAGGATAQARDGVWCERLPMPPLEGLATETLALLRALLRLRREHPALRSPTIRLVGTDGPLLAFERGAGAERLWIALNPSPHPRRLALSGRRVRSLLALNARAAAINLEEVVVGPFAGHVLLVAG